MNEKVDLSMDEDQRPNNKEKHWLICPVYKSKTRIRLQVDTVLEHFPLFCPKCKQETLINVKQLNISVIQELDAQTMLIAISHNLRSKKPLHLYGILRSWIWTHKSYIYLSLFLLPTPMRFYVAWAFAVITPTWGRKGVRKWWIVSSTGNILSALLTPFARLSFTMQRWTLTRKYGRNSSLRYNSTIFGSLTLSRLPQQTSILWKMMCLPFLPFAGKRSL